MRRPRVAVLLLALCNGAWGELSEEVVTDSTAVCEWPACAPYLKECVPHDVGMCLVPALDGGCPKNSRCRLGRCLCARGYCPQGNRCVAGECTLGARPPKWVPNSWVNFFLSLAPEAPPPHAGTAEWRVFAVDSAKTLPLLLVVAGFVVAVATLVFLCSDIEHDCTCCPKSPWLLVGWTLFTILLILFGVVSRHVIAKRTWDVAEENLGKVNFLSERAQHLGVELENVCDEWDGMLAGLVASCNSWVPFAKQIAEKGVTKAKNLTDSGLQSVRRFNRATRGLPAVMAKAKAALDDAMVVWFWGPVFPVVLMLMACVTILVATLASWCSRNPRVAEFADMFVLRCGACFLAMLVILSTTLAAGFLQFGMVGGAFCKHVDENVLNIASHVNFTQLANASKDVNVTVMQSLDYYIRGNSCSPILNLLDDLEVEIQLMQGIWNDSKWMVDSASEVCKALTRFPANSMLHSALTTVDMGQEFMQAKYVWPAYSQLMRESACEDILHSMYRAIVSNALVGLLCFPVLACLADIDLKKWSEHKRANYYKHYGEEESDMEQELQPWDMSRSPESSATWEPLRTRSRSMNIG